MGVFQGHMRSDIVVVEPPLVNEAFDHDADEKDDDDDDDITDMPPLDGTYVLLTYCTHILI